VKLFLSRCISDEDTHTQSHLLPVLSTSPIDDYYDGGTVRVNTEFYSWDTSFGLVNPRLRYSCLQIVFCANLGTFFKCFVQLGWRLMGVRSTHTECSLNVPCMFLYGHTIWSHESLNPKFIDRMHPTQDRAHGIGQTEA
jgi:hypothetical protein